MTRLFALVILMATACTAFAGNSKAPQYYEYILYLGPRTAQDPVAVAQAKLPATLAQHRQITPSALRAWNGQGKTPFALELRSFTGKTIDQGEIFDTAEPLREVVGVRSPKPVTGLAVMVGVPNGLNIPAYVEALRLTVEAAKALQAQAFTDGETGALYRIDGLAERLSAGQQGRNQPVSVLNPPAVTIMGGITALVHTQNGGVELHGMRKAGVPDLSLGDWIPGVTETLIFDVVGNRMLAGKIPPRPGAAFEVRVGEPGVADELDLYGRPGAAAPLRFADQRSNGNLRIEFPGPAKLDLYQRQTLFLNALVPSRYVTLAPAKQQELSLAIAGVKSQMRNLRASFPVLRNAGTRLFVASRMDLQIRDLKAMVVWSEVISWDRNGQMVWRRWRGDPRAGGVVERWEKPVTIDGQTYVYIDSDMDEGHVEDLLILDSSGKSAGGEVESLIKHWAKGAVSKPD